MLNAQSLGVALANPSAVLMQLDKYESEKSLLNFMKLGWHALEPGVEFVPNWGVHAICDHLEAVTRGDIKRLLINVPPGTTKSMSCGVFWPAWEWGPKKLSHHRFLCGSYRVGLAERDAKRSRDLINSEWYQSLWSNVFQWKKDQNAKVNYQNSKTGWRISSPAASMTGERGDRVMMDDPHSVEGAESTAELETMLRTFAETVPTRLNKQSESAIIVVMQRLRERDVSGHILANELGYEHVMIPMEFEAERRCYSSVMPSYIKNPKKTQVWYDKASYTWQPEEIKDSRCEERYNIDTREKDGDLLDPVRFPRDSIDDLKKVMRTWGGTYAEAGQLQQRPVPREGGLFKKGDFKFIDSISGITGRVVSGWDLAASDGKDSPYSVRAKMMMAFNGDIIIIDVNRFRKTPGPLEMEIKRTAEQDGKSVVQDFPQDPGQAGKVQKSSIAKLLHGYDVTFSPETGSKEMRATPFAAQVECGNVYLLRGSWNDEFLNEVCMFPNGQYKDQTDAASRAYSKLLKTKKIFVPSAPRRITA